jgi:predicted glycosyltransferase
MSAPRHTSAPISTTPRRVMLYTHNSVGLGHVFRSLAVLTGMRYWAPAWDFLAVSGSSIPQAFLGEGIEVLKLPGARMTVEQASPGLSPRHLKSLSLDGLFDLRTKLILDAFDCFAPEVVLVEHNLAGLMNELVPLLLKKRMRRGGPRDFALAHVSRGIMRPSPGIQLPRQNPPHLADSIDLAELYDFVYVLEDRQIAEADEPLWQTGSGLAERTAFLGKIAIRNRAELPTAPAAKRKWGLSEAPLILLSLGRFGAVSRMTRALGEALARDGLGAGHQLAVVVDPYLDPSEKESLQRCANELGAALLGFNPYLVELVNAAELVVCRAGYNTFNEVLLSGVRALFVCEVHGGLEQERRVRQLAGAHQGTVSEEQVLVDGAREMLQRLLAAPRDSSPPVLDRFAIGGCMVRDLEQWWSGRSQAGSGG